MKIIILIFLFSHLSYCYAQTQADKELIGNECTYWRAIYDASKLQMRLYDYRRYLSEQFYYVNDEQTGNWNLKNKSPFSDSLISNLDSQTRRVFYHRFFAFGAKTLIIDTSNFFSSKCNCTIDGHKFIFLNRLPKKHRKFIRFKKHYMVGAKYFGAVFSIQFRPVSFQTLNFDFDPLAPIVKVKEIRQGSF
jgi:hypothetical protein